MDLVGSELRATPDLYPLGLDVFQDNVYFIRLTQARYTEASFLDQRVALRGDEAGWAAWGPVRDATAPLTGESDYLFHVGHVGSTLAARLLGLSPRIFALREPAILRTLAHVAFDMPTPESPWSQPVFDEHLDVFSRLWARTYDPGQRTLLKATSLVSEVAAPLMARSTSARAILMTVAPEVYMATVFGGEGSRAELKTAVQSRLRRLHRRIGASPWRLHAMSEGELAVMSWVCEMVGLVDAANASPDRVLWLDFERFLANPAEGLSAALVRLHGEAPAADVEAMLTSPLFGRYSKGPEHAYDAGLRRRVLDQARGEFGAELSKGMAWLDRAAAETPLIGQALAVVDGL